MACTNCGCKNKPCGCEDGPLTTPAPCNPIGCPDPYPCSEVIDSQCVLYSGDPIICNQDTVVDTGDNLANALNQVVDYFCDQPTDCCPILEVDITFQRSIAGYTLIANPVGDAPFTYQWTIEQDELVGLSFSGPTTGNSVILVTVPNYYTPVPALSAEAYQCLVKVKVTNGSGQVATAYYNAVILQSPA